jgi:hypothetical protein
LCSTASTAAASTAAAALTRACRRLARDRCDHHGEYNAYRN